MVDSRLRVASDILQLRRDDKIGIRMNLARKADRITRLLAHALDERILAWSGSGLGGGCEPVLVGNA